MNTAKFMSIKKSLFALLLCVVLVSCKKNQEQGQQKSLFASSSLSPEPIKKIHSKETFKEGTIAVDIYFPGNELSNLLKKIDPSKGNVEQQMESLVTTIDPEEQAKIKSVMQGNPIMAMQLIFAPLLSNKIFVKEGRVTAKCDGLTYHLENTLDVGTSSGMIFIKSQYDSNKAVTFTYDQTFFGESQLQTKIDMTLYNRQLTNETEVIAGYKCKKSIYTLKEAHAMSIGKLEVWTSEQMPKSLNFIHPYYLEEDHGIMKIGIYPTQKDKEGMIYEFKTVTPGKVTDSDMKIEQNTPVYNAKTELNELAGGLMAIMFGTEY